jgi:hypothetical protein
LFAIMYVLLDSDRSSRMMTKIVNLIV